MTYSHVSAYLKNTLPMKPPITHISQMHYKHIPYKARTNLVPHKFRTRSRVAKMEGLVPRRTVFFILLLSFAPYFLPETQKPDIYRVKTKAELETQKRDQFIGGKIDDLPFY